MNFSIGDEVVSVSVQERGVGNARIWFRYQGRQRTINSGVKKGSELSKRDILGLVKVWESQQPKPNAKPISEGTPFRTAMERHFRHKHSKNEPDTLKGNVSILEALGAALRWPLVETITKEMFRDVEAQLKGDNAPKTWANKLGEMRHFSKWLVVEDIIEKDFTRGIDMPSRSEFGTREEIYREEWFAPIHRELPLEWRDAFEDAWFTGMDSKDLWEFRPRQHIVIGEGNWKVWKLRAKEQQIIDQPLSSRIRDRWVARYEKCGKDDPLHANVAGRSAKVWGRNLLTVVHDAQRKLGLPKLDVKTTRHTFATRHVLRLVRGEKNAPTMDQIRRWLGHAPDSRVLERLYAKLKSQAHLMD